MSNNRAQSWARVCPICGATYRLTNWMRRSTRTATGWAKTDTHIMACERKRAAAGGGA